VSADFELSPGQIRRIAAILVTIDERIAARKAAEQSPPDRPQDRRRATGTARATREAADAVTVHERGER
jgi:hypothetical protein